MSRRIILTVLMTAFVCLGASAQRWAAKTNLGRNDSKYRS